MQHTLKTSTSQNHSSSNLKPISHINSNDGNNFEKNMLKVRFLEDFIENMNAFEKTQSAFDLKQFVTKVFCEINRTIGNFSNQLMKCQNRNS